MITDNIKNIKNYDNISEGVKEFLLSLSSETPVGHYEIEQGAYANVDEYETKPLEKCKLEAHKKYIDIQMILTGEEELDYISVDGLNVSEAYDENRDVMFFEPPDCALDTIRLTCGKFALIYPHEAHRPQMRTNAVKVKKVVVKIIV